MKTTIWAIGFLFSMASTSALAYTCQCLGTTVSTEKQHTVYSGNCRIAHINRLAQHNEKFDNIVFNNTKEYNPMRDLVNFIPSVKLVNQLNESKKTSSSVYDKQSGFLCSGAPELQIRSKNYLNVYNLFPDKNNSK